jgi:hypothetical protein
MLIIAINDYATAPGGCEYRRAKVALFVVMSCTIVRVCRKHRRRPAQGAGEGLQVDEGRSIHAEGCLRGYNETHDMSPARAIGAGLFLCLSISAFEFVSRLLQRCFRGHSPAAANIATAISCPSPTRSSSRRAPNGLTAVKRVSRDSINFLASETDKCVRLPKTRPGRTTDTHV